MKKAGRDQWTDLLVRPVFGATDDPSQHLHGAPLTALMLLMTSICHQSLQARLELLQKHVPKVTEYTLKKKRYQLYNTWN